MNKEDSTHSQQIDQEDQIQTKIKLKSDKIVVNVSDTQYQVVKDVCKDYFKWRLQIQKETFNWDLFWTDNAVSAQFLGKMGTHQKINHFPGMFTLARKNHLARNLNKFRKRFQQQYSFFPQTWLLPAQFIDLKTNIQTRPKGKARTYIAKPQAGCQGRGIFLTRTIASFDPGQHYVVQRYIPKPYLIQGLKFDMRIYVLVAGCDPLRIYMYEQGLGRLATVAYQGPRPQNLEDLCMHLTNYAINKQNQNFIFNQDQNDMSVGHKRSLTSIYKTLVQQGIDLQTLKQEIKDIIIKTLIVGQPILSHHYKACQSDSLANNMCFQILGFDILIDEKAKPYLLQINHTPSFTTDTPLDLKIKQNLIKDTLRLMNISTKSRNEIINLKKIQLQNRMLTGKKQRLTVQQRRQLIQRLQRQRDQYQCKNLGQFQLIYPVYQEKKYQQYNLLLQFSSKCYQEQTGANIKRNTKKVQTRIQLTKIQSKKIILKSQSKPSFPTKLQNQKFYYKPQFNQKDIIAFDFPTQNNNIQAEDAQSIFPLIHNRLQEQNIINIKLQISKLKTQKKNKNKEQKLKSPNLQKGQGNFLQPKLFSPSFSLSKKTVIKKY